MGCSSDPSRLYSDRVQSYVRFVRLVGYPQGLRAYFVGSSLLRSGLRVLDAGCGTGIVTLALREALRSRGQHPGSLHGFDLTPAMLECFREAIQRAAIKDIAVVQADVLRLEMLPESWSNYDLIVSASMMEYLPRERLVEALAGLRERLNAEGRLLLFITKRNWLMRPLIGHWWDANLYKDGEIETAFRQAGFSTASFRRFPLAFRYLAFWGHIVEAQR
jgi:ubiquinone/menaquinone biosynthesis C-methylase UbiE